MFAPALDALHSYNSLMPGAVNDAKFGTMWFPHKSVAIDDKQFGSYGLGSSHSKANWIVIQGTSTLAHELGHNKGRLRDLYFGECFQPANRIPAWAIYVDYKSVPVNQIRAVMDCDAANRVVHPHADYQTLYNSLGDTAAQQMEGAAQESRQFIISGAASPEGELSRLYTTVAEGVQITPPA